MSKAPNVNRPPSMPVAKQDPFSGTNRMKDGYILTIREQATGMETVIHRGGKNALGSLCWDIDEMDGDWKVVSMCTPTTIYRDLQGTRMSEWADKVEYPEIATFGKIKRLDLLDPFFTPYIPRGRSHI